MTALKLVLLVLNSHWQCVVVGRRLQPASVGEVGCKTAVMEKVNKKCNIMV